ncbi:MAG: ABC transporter substrate-binding protein [Dehalococcoidales bacterium]|nr:ABC transporter substrate-binding protein [Dehalococcoidales bacterium]
MKQKLLSLIAVTCLIISVLCGCTHGGKTSTTTTPDKPTGTYTFTDSVNRNVEIPYDIKKYIPSGPVSQMMLIAIAPERMAALATKLDDAQKGFLPDYLFDLPYVGQLYGSADLNKETLAAYNPDLIIDLGEPKKTIVEDMDNLTSQTGVPAIHITATINRNGEAYRTLGKILGCEERGNAIATYCDQIAGNLLDITRAVANNKVRIAYISGNGSNSANVIAKNSYHAEVIDLMFDNVAVVDNPSGKGTGNTVDLEQLLLWDPEALIIGDYATYDLIKSGKADAPWYELSAVKNGKYYGIPTIPYNWFGVPPSVNRYIGIVWMSNKFYPEYSSFDLKAETVKFYKLFYNIDLTDAQYNDLMSRS